MVSVKHCNYAKEPAGTFIPYMLHFGGWIQRAQRIHVRGKLGVRVSHFGPKEVIHDGHGAE